MVIKRNSVLRLIAVVLFSVVMFPAEADAQRRFFRFQNRLEHDLRPYHFGFSLGINTMNYAIRPVESLREGQGFDYVLPEPDFGFHIGIVSNLKLNQYLDLRFIPAISFGDRHLEYYLPDDMAGTGYSSDWQRREPHRDQDLEVTLLEFPLHLKYKSARMTNTRVYVLGGFKYSHDLASIELGAGEEILARVARNDIHYEVGVGFDHYFYYFKFSGELKGSFGMFDLLRPGDDGFERYYNSIDRLNARSIMISLTFE